MAVVAVALVVVAVGICSCSRSSSNRWATRTVEVVPGQELVTTGPYAAVRHPMYLGVLTMYLAAPLAWGPGGR